VRNCARDEPICLEYPSLFGPHVSSTLNVRARALTHLCATVLVMNPLTGQSQLMEQLQASTLRIQITAQQCKHSGSELKGLASKRMDQIATCADSSTCRTVGLLVRKFAERLRTCHVMEAGR